MSLGSPRPRPDDALTPAQVATVVGVPASAVEFVWRNADGGLTFRYHSWAASSGPYGGLTYFSWVPSDQRSRCEAARARAAWAAPYIAVPRFSRIGQGLDGWWMTSPALPGESVVRQWGKAHPRQAVTAVATGLRWLHERAPVVSCPYVWEAETRFTRARRAVEEGDDWRQAPDDYLAGWDRARALEVLARGVTRETDPVVCHGDPCAPNTLLAPPGGAFAGLVDLGDLGVADRWADLAVATWSLNWNFGPGWEEVFYAAYGIEPDQEKIDFYRLLWNVG